MGVEAKGGIAMKILVSVVAAGVLAGAAGLSAFGFRPFDRLTALSIVEGLSEPRDTGGGPAAAAVADGKPAPVNEYKGMQDREEVFEFAEKPKVTKAGDKWIITFASKGKCDATVTILGPDGKVVRRLASGVLGKNAPWPFQQDSLSQKLEWDGLTDTRKPAPAGCKVKVGLGLQAKFERNILWDPNLTNGDVPVVLGKGKNGELYVGHNAHMNSWGRLYDKDGKYLRTFWPPSAAELEKATAAMGVQMVPTVWGDKVPVAESNFWTPGCNTVQLSQQVKDLPEALAKTETYSVKHFVRVMEKVYGLDPATLQRAAVPAVIPPEQPWAGTARNIMAKVSHLDVDPDTEELYAGSWTLFRLNGKTGELDPTWFPKGELSMCEYAVAPEGLIYVRTGPYGKLIVRLDRDGKPVPFKENTMVPAWQKKPWSWKPKFLPDGASGIDTGMAGFSATQQNGFHVSADGSTIVTIVREIGKEWGIEHKLPFTDRWYQDAFIQVYSSDGRLLAANAAGEIRGGNGLGIDRERNIYSAFAFTMPFGQGKLDGLAEDPPKNMISYWRDNGSLVKLRGLGGKYPVGGVVPAKDDPAALKVYCGTYRGKHGEGARDDLAIAGGQWAYGGLTTQSFRGCSCGHARFYLDRSARVFVPTNHLFSIMVLDSNGNRIARFGRYGNVDDNDPKHNGLHFTWPRAVCASDTAMYVTDYGSMRILKAALSYAAEETVPAP
jgi:hypothetical protein